ncbi:hypothetical protein P4O66_005057, partial [Electrophorus voltai]
MLWCNPYLLPHALQHIRASNPYLPTRGGTVTSGGRFRCPSCRHEVVLDRHGVYGLQRNLLVENIIDMYKQEPSSSRPAPERKADQPLCEVHQDEKINIYCLTCAVPTCSMCKVFGSHKDCEVAPIKSVYQLQKTELTDGIAMMVGNNNRIQGIISQLEETCRAIEVSCPVCGSVPLLKALEGSWVIDGEHEVNSRKQKSQVCEKFDHLYTILEERKQEMSGRVTAEKEEKLGYIRGLKRKYEDHLECMTKIVESGIQTMQEPEMAVFLQSTKCLLQNIGEASNTSQLEKVECGYENMDHYTVNFKKEGKALNAIDFVRDEVEEQEDGGVVGAEGEGYTGQATSGGA